MRNQALQVVISEDFLNAEMEKALSFLCTQGFRFIQTQGYSVHAFSMAFTDRTISR